MSEMKYTDESFRRPAAKAFSTSTFMDEIERVYVDPIFEGFTLEQLVTMREISRQALNEVNNQDVYGNEVLVAMGEEDVVYIEEDGQLIPLSFDAETVLYGYVRQAMIRSFPHDKRPTFTLALEAYDDGNTRSYFVPVATEGTDKIAQIHDAPVPVMESDVESDTRTMLDPKMEADEEGTMLSLLNIVEQDIFYDGGVKVKDMSRAVGDMFREGFIETLDDMTTVCNYFLQKSAHNDDNWGVYVATVLERFTGEVDSGDTLEPARTEMKWVQDVIELAGVDFVVDAYDEVKCILYARHEGDLYRVYEAASENLVIAHIEEDDQEDF